MSSSKSGSLVIDDARLALCHELAGCINAGSFAVRIRRVNSGDRPAALFLAHRPTGWRKRRRRIDEPALILALDEALATLAAVQHDDWSVQRRAHADGYDVDLHFHPQKLTGRLGSSLEVYLSGVLFRDSHDSKKDSRRSIRTPRQTGSNRQRRRVRTQSVKVSHAANRRHDSSSRRSNARGT
jgi:hypothetical protein